MLPKRGRQQHAAEHAPESSYNYGTRASGEQHGVVLTKPHIVELILDLVNYQETRDLARLRLLEPSCGQGVFLLLAIERLLRSAHRHGHSPSELGDSLLAIEVNQEQAEHTRERVTVALQKAGLPTQTAQGLATKWVVCADFLLHPIPNRVDFVVGNPPYVRIEQIPIALQTEYRTRYVSLFDRADLYVAFIERSLSLLSDDGMLSFICADRWTRNRYGAPLRKLISDHFVVRSYLDLSAASPFESAVSAYPSIFVMTPKSALVSASSPVNVVTMLDASADECTQLRKLLSGTPLTLPPQTPQTGNPPQLRIHDHWFVGTDPWVLGSPEQLRVLRKLEQSHPLLESCGARVGIGVATGLDRVFIVDQQQAAKLEPDRVLPLVMRQDLADGQIRAAGRFVLHTFTEEGLPIDLAHYPKLSSYLAKHARAVKGRHVAKRSGSAWFRTIDRVKAKLLSTPKLLVADIAEANLITLDPGHYYPHHNLYYITAEGIDLAVLGGLLSSRVALFFIWSYAVTLRGRYLRFQAQYLRRIRIPRPDSLSQALQDDLRRAFFARDTTALDALALQAYGLSALPAFDCGSSSVTRGSDGK